jgi:AcrR family transcriptional regulator
MARTQQQRREDTVARLLEASIATIIDVGYARASAAVITRRAGLSGGALFRHFDTMGDFMAATANEVMRRKLETFSKQAAEIPADQPVLEAVVHIVQGVAGDVVMQELQVAARTDEKLRATLQEVLKAYGDRMLDTARALPTADQYPDEVLAALVALLVNTFDGAALVRNVLPQPELDALRIPFLMSLLAPKDRSEDA